MQITQDTLLTSVDFQFGLVVNKLKIFSISEGLEVILRYEVFIKENTMCTYYIERITFILVLADMWFEM